MRITVNVQLAEGDGFAYTPDAGAAQVLAALGGNPTKDSCELYLVAPTQPGHAGVDPEPPADG